MTEDAVDHIGKTFGKIFFSIRTSMASSHHPQAQGSGTTQANLPNLRSSSDKKTLSRTLASVGKDAAYAVGYVGKLTFPPLLLSIYCGTQLCLVISPVIVAGVLGFGAYRIGKEIVLWTKAASTGTLEDYNRRKEQRFWAAQEVGGGDTPESRPPAG
ncbi:hypothetical protein DL96DRAFT_1818226 [Flagelloscypha sp. PMI_526]|nr:hypothetical protein DL96DRAFT_1818226 [Flagelloscypha sp. PMI_526]